MGNPATNRLKLARERALIVALRELNATLADRFERDDISTPAQLRKVTGLSPHIAAKVLRGQMKDPPLSTLLTLMAALDLRSMEELLAPLGSTPVMDAWNESIGS